MSDLLMTLMLVSYRHPWSDAVWIGKDCIIGNSKADLCENRKWCL